jgi:hypothetical protein
MADLTREALEKFPTLVNQVRDNKAWAKRILWREQNGDDTMTITQIAIAHGAIDNPQG